VKDIRDAVEQAHAALQRSGRHTILFVDEVHRFNKSQQDAFYPLSNPACSPLLAPPRKTRLSK
jgi:replication-associated recombination protein RarA